jgi:ankyrin repeat protein
MAYLIAIAVGCALFLGLRLWSWAGDAQRCARSGRLDRLRALVGEQLSRVHVRNWAGEQPVHQAAKGGHVEVLRFLLDSRAEVNARTRAGVTPLHFAAAMGHLEAVRFLLERGADESLEDRFGVTALDGAEEGGHLELVELLRSAAASKVRSSA